MWGYVYNWTNPDDGWIHERRKEMLVLKRKILKQLPEVPAYTKLGLKKMKMPTELHSLLLNRRNTSDVSYEDCLIDDPMHNCQRVKKEIVVPFRNKFRDVIGQSSQFLLRGNP